MSLTIKNLSAIIAFMMAAVCALSGLALLVFTASLHNHTTDLLKTTQVLDSGIGVGSEESDRIFEPFRRSNSTINTIPGVGLGLFTAKAIVLAHAGKISNERNLKKGSKFTVCLPLYKPALRVLSEKVSSFATVKQ